jgi:hypothetical protein
LVVVVVVVVVFGFAVVADDATRSNQYRLKDKQIK